MVLRKNDSYSSFIYPGVPYLHPTSSSFGILDGRSIERSFMVVGRRLRTQLLSLIDAITGGTIGVQRFTNSVRAFIRAAYFDAYSLGALSIFPFYTMTGRDVLILDGALNEETGFLQQFGNDLHRGRLRLDPSTRASLYLLALRGIFEQGRVEAMPPGPYRWQLGSTEHCSACWAAVEGGPYQRSRAGGLGLPILPGIPGDGSVCFGLTRCGCTIELENGIPLPNADLAERLRGLLLEVIYGSSPTASRTTTE